MGNPGLSDEQAREAWQLYLEHGCNAKRAADAIGMSRETMRNRISVARLRGFHLSDGAREIVKGAGLSGLEAKGGWIPTFDGEGKKIGNTYWRADEGTATDDTFDRIAERMSQVRPAQPLPEPSGCDDDLLNFIPKFDVHLGMRVGSFGTKEAVSRLMAGFRDVLDRAPRAATTIILNGGDFTEANDNSALTPENKHPLAVDMEYDDVLDVAIDVTIDMIEHALTKSDRVIYQALAGNHDRATARAIRQGLRQRYRDNPRFHMPEGYNVFAHKWGDNLLFGIHGDQKVSNPRDLALSLAERYRKEWTETTRTEIWRGHRHREEVVSLPGVRVNQVNPICPPGRYANQNLFTGQSDIQCVTYKRSGGRRAVTPYIFDDI